MPNGRIRILLFICFPLIAYLPGGAQTSSHKLTFSASNGNRIDVQNGVISVNGKNLRWLTDDELIYPSKRSRIIEDGGSVFLFLEVDGRPNLDRLYVYKVTVTKVDSVTNVVSSDIKDWDGDGYLEFGGRDLTEVHPSRDSMYYIPSTYYEIRSGKIVYDTVYTRQVDRQINGIYLSNPVDEQGFCCKVIPKPGKKNTSILVDTSLASERIDGPANIRDTSNGKQLFELNDNVAVETSDTINKWCRIGLLIDLTPLQIQTHLIQKGTPLLSNGRVIGRTLDTIHLRGLRTVDDKYKGELRGFTAISNIKPQTIPEKVLSRIITANGPMDVSDLDYFLAAFKFSVIMAHPYSGEYLDGDPLVYNENHPLRLLLLFDGRRLYGVVHARQLDYHGSREYALRDGYTLTTIGHPPQRLVNDFIKNFNATDPTR